MVLNTCVKVSTRMPDVTFVALKTANVEDNIFGEAVVSGEDWAVFNAARAVIDLFGAEQVLECGGLPV